MKRDDLGICLSKDMLSRQLYSTFTHVRAYDAKDSCSDEMLVLLSFPQMSGRELLSTMQSSKKLVWRADYFCPADHHF